MRRRIRPFLARCGAAAILAGSAAACSDFLAAPAEGPARLTVAYAMSGAASSTLAPVDRLHVRLARGGVAVVDSSFPVTGGSTELRRTFSIEMDEAEAEMELEIELLWQDTPMFAGSTRVWLVQGRWNTAEITLWPADEPARIYGYVRDLQTLAPVTGAIVTLAEPEGTSPRVVTVAADGRYVFEDVYPGDYTVSVAAQGYGGNTAGVRVRPRPQGDVVQIGFDLPATTGPQVGGVAGRVLDPQGALIGGATVMISGGMLTNGVFKSVLTAADGTYTLPGISLTVAGGAPISSFTVLAAANGRQTGRRDSLVATAGRTVANVDFTLAAGGAVQTFFADGFESGFAWQAGGMWNPGTGVGIVNTAVPAQARLAPDDTSAALPRAAEGSRYLWYGNPATGNYLGTGTNAGTVLSPAFMIPAGTLVASLNFRIWFEIEAVNPATFDSMTVSIVDVSTGTTHQLALLNPVSDPNFDGDLEPVPFTSGGFNRAPVFRPVALDVSQFAGRQVRIAFRFNTNDGRYNYFRGWIVDDVRVTSEPAMASTASLRVQRPPFRVSPPCRARCVRTR